METITIPSPTAFLASPVLNPTPDKPAPPPKRKSSATAKPSSSSNSSSTKNSSGVAKPKQSKSRNGCITCKAKRLKCDEVHPSCQQCHKRGVVCGGYKKDFKWRPFEETTFANKPPPTRAKRASSNVSRENVPPARSPSSDGCSSNPLEESNANTISGTNFMSVSDPNPLPLPTFTPTTSFSDLDFASPPSNMFDMSTFPYAREIPGPRSEADKITRSLSSLFEDSMSTPVASTSRPTVSGQSPRLLDLLSPGSELNARPGTVSIPPLAMPIPAIETSPIVDEHIPLSMDINLDPEFGDDVEEIVREPQQDMWMSIRGPVPTPRPDSPAIIPMYLQPEMQAGSPEQLMHDFDQQTCGILSVKDGPTENPWRTLVWPLARDSPALYHAIASMTAFHMSRGRPALRVDGMEHMRASICSLATGIEKMRTDTALATTLVLAFAESWDQHISTGIEHLRGARILVNQAMTSHRKHNLSGNDLARLRFLRNTFIYMDVIARLTSSSCSSKEDDSFDVPTLPPTTNEIDPLMGLASTLFPIIGQVAMLCRKVCTSTTNSIAVIGEAIELKEAIVQWSPPQKPDVCQPEDPTAEVQHAVQTAEAYRYATLLYLHQTVPEIPSWTSEQLAQKVLKLLATVPQSSRLIIVQIYPLLAAGCEVTSTEDRSWVRLRWEAMIRRMWIGNIDACWKVTQEVWRRRDEAALAKSAVQKVPVTPTLVRSGSSKRTFEEATAIQDDGCSFSDMLNDNGPSKRARNGSRSGSFSRETSGGELVPRKRVHEDEEEMDREITVRGRLHWVGVMKDLNWEILLG